MESFLNGIYPEDRDGFIGNLSAGALDEDVMRERGYDFRFARKDGSLRRYRSLGHLFRDEEGRPLKYQGVTIDITESRENSRLNAVLQSESASLSTIHEMPGSGKRTMDFDEAGNMVRAAFRKKKEALLKRTADLKAKHILLAEDVAINAFDEDVQRSMQAGLNAHLSKPVEPDLLFETLESFL